MGLSYGMVGDEKKHTMQTLRIENRKPPEAHWYMARSLLQSLRPSGDLPTVMAWESGRPSSPTFGLRSGDLSKIQFLRYWAGHSQLTVCASNGVKSQSKQALR